MFIEQSLNETHCINTLQKNNKYFPKGTFKCVIILRIFVSTFSSVQKHKLEGYFS